MKKNIRVKSGTKDQVEGNFHKAKGNIKENIGKLSNNSELESEGKTEKFSGMVQEKIGQIKKIFNK
jgi:uncharacterized protein YjbJ (UPF0337 family)